MSDLPWWKVAAEQSIERKAAAKRNDSGVNPGDSFLIVTEGTATEPIYFQHILKEMKLSIVEIHIQPGDRSHPISVIETAVRLAKDRKVEMKKQRENQSFCKVAFDHVWAVIDTDVAVRDGIWDQVKSAAKKGKISLASSTPCFEYWLMLHLKYTSAALVDGRTAKATLKEAGYDCSSKESASVSIPKLIPLLQKAIEHAKQVRRLHVEARTPDPANPSTCVDRLLEALADSLLKIRKKS